MDFKLKYVKNNKHEFYMKLFYVFVDYLSHFLIILNIS